MKELVFRELWILSKAEKKAINLSLGRNINLLIGENDVGKSTLIKSLYHCLGADVPQMNNSTWKRARPIYCVKFELAGKQYYVVRDEKYFGVFNSKKEIISKHIGITGENGVAHFINRRLGFNVELERQANGKLGLAGPAFYFLPFYIDQDEGWSASWSSFVGLKQFKQYRKLMIEYHLGVRPQTYYDAKKREIELQEKREAIEVDRLSLQAARNSIEKRKIRTRVDLDPAVLHDELEVVVAEYRKVYEQQQEILSRLKEVRSERNIIDSELQILRRAISELEADYGFAEAPDTPDSLGCPTCGTEFRNSFVERFGILDDIDHCHALVDQWMKKRKEVDERIQGVETEYRSLSSDLSDLKAALERKKENVTLSEIISSQGMKEMVSSLNADINEMLVREAGINEEITDNAEDLKIDRDRKKEIVAWYKARMKEFLNDLNVSVLEEEDYKALDRQIKNNALGSDLPRALLAQQFAFLSAMNKFNSFVFCPLLIDSPFQQEQDSTNSKAIFDFIVNKRLKDQQVILATISVDEFSEHSELPRADIHEFKSKHSVLESESYEDVLEEIGPMHRQALSASE